MVLLEKNVDAGYKMYKMEPIISHLYQFVWPLDH